MGKNIKRTPKIAGYRLVVWCKGGLDDNGSPITSPWCLVYAPFWLGTKGEHKPAAPGWNNAPLVHAVVNTIHNYTTADNAFHILSTLSDDHLVKDATAFNPSDSEVIIVN